MRSIHTYILFLILFATAWSWCVSSSFAASKNRFTVVIDAGHGGHDPGAIGRKSKEKNINLNIALRLGKLIENNCNDVRVVYTRKTDVFIPLDRRARIANNAKADLFISIHTNSLPKGRIARGAETYTLGMARASENLEVAQKENSVILIEDNYKERYAGFNPNSAESYIIFEFMQDKFMAQSVRLAQMTQKQFRQTAGRKDKGVHQAGFLVLRATSMPSVLIELGYISTPDEENYLNSEVGLRDMSRSIFRAFLNYKEEQTGIRSTIVQENIQDQTNDQDNINEPENDRSEPLPERQVERMERVEQKEIDSKPRQKNSVRKGTGKPVFKVQVLTGPRKYSTKDARFKGEKEVDYYVDKGVYKYTIGSSTNYNKTFQELKRLGRKFKGAFIVAFKGNERVDLQNAIEEFKKNR